MGIPVVPRIFPRLLVPNAPTLMGSGTACMGWLKILVTRLLNSIMLLENYYRDDITTASQRDNNGKEEGKEGKKRLPHWFVPQIAPPLPDFKRNGLMANDVRQSIESNDAVLLLQCRRGHLLAGALYTCEIIMLTDFTPTTLRFARHLLNHFVESVH